MAHAAVDEMALNKNALVKGQVLMVCTSHGSFPGTDVPTGLWLGELAEPYYALADAGYDVTLCSPNGGGVPIDPASLGDDFKTPEGSRMLADDAAKQLLERTVKLADISDVALYDAVFIPGGHGPMYDLYRDEALGELLSKAAAAGKVIAAVCHGPAGLLRAKGSDGQPLVSGRAVTGFTNSEEEAVGKTKMVDFLLEDALREQGGAFERAPDWQEKVVVDGNLITGQNPGSARGVGKAILAALQERRAGLKDPLHSGHVSFTAGEAGLA